LRATNKALDKDESGADAVILPSDESGDATSLFPPLTNKINFKLPGTWPSYLTDHLSLRLDEMARARINVRSSP